MSDMTGTVVRKFNREGSMKRTGEIRGVRLQVTLYTDNWDGRWEEVGQIWNPAAPGDRSHRDDGIPAVTSMSVSL